MMCRHVFAAVLVAIAIAAPFDAFGMSVEPVPLLELTAKTDAWVRCRVVDIELRPLSKAMKEQFNHEGDFEVKATLQILDAVPAIPEHGEWKLHAPTLKEWTGNLEEGEYIAALRKNADGTWRGHWALGVFGLWRIDPSTNTVAHMPEVGRNMPVDLAWQLVSTLRTMVDAPNSLATSVVDGWETRLSNGNALEYGAAMVVISAQPAPAIDARKLMEAFQRQYSLFRSDATQIEPYSAFQVFRPIIESTLTLLERIGDEASSGALVTLIESDSIELFSVFDQARCDEPVVRAILSSGGNDRVSMLKRVLGRTISVKVDGRRQGEHVPVRSDYAVLRAVAKYPGADVDVLLMDVLAHPQAYGIADVLSLAGVWEGMAERGQPAIKTYLEDLLAQPKTFDLGLPPSSSRDKLEVYAREALAAFRQQDTAER